MKIRLTLWVGLFYCRLLAAVPPRSEGEKSTRATGHRC